MAGEEETDGLEFLLQPLGGQPRLDRRQCQRRTCRGPAKKLRLPERYRIMRTLRGRQHDIDGGKDAGAVALERIEGAGGG